MLNYIKRTILGFLLNEFDYYFHVSPKQDWYDIDVIIDCDIIKYKHMSDYSLKLKLPDKLKTCLGATSLQNGEDITDEFNEFLMGNFDFASHLKLLPIKFHTIKVLDRDCVETAYHFESKMNNGIDYNFDEMENMVFLN